MNNRLNEIYDWESELRSAITDRFQADSASLTQSAIDIVKKAIKGKEDECMSYLQDAQNAAFEAGDRGR